SRRARVRSVRGRLLRRARSGAAGQVRSRAARADADRHVPAARRRGERARRERRRVRPPLPRSDDPAVGRHVGHDADHRPARPLPPRGEDQARLEGGPRRAVDDVPHQDDDADAPTHHLRDPAMSRARMEKRRTRRRKKEAGIALVMVLGAIAVLTVMLAEFQDDTSNELASAMADRDSVQAEYMARSAINLARLLIASEPTIRAQIAPLFMLMKRTPPQLPVWEFSDRLLGAFNDSEASKDFAGTVGVDLSLGKNLGMPGGRWELTIVDEDSKIDANLGASNEIAHIRLARELMGLMAPPLYDPMFLQKDPQGNVNDRLAVCSALIDWADTDDNLFSCDLTTQTAASGNAKEDAYYQL